MPTIIRTNRFEGRELRQRTIKFGFSFAETSVHRTVRTLERAASWICAIELGGAAKHEFEERLLETLLQDAKGRCRPFRADAALPYEPTGGTTTVPRSRLPRFLRFGGAGKLRLRVNREKINGQIRSAQRNAFSHDPDATFLTLVWSRPDAAARLLRLEKRAVGNRNL